MHRDIKLDNIILIEKDGKKLIKLIDFGLSAIHSEDKNIEPILNKNISNGTVVGYVSCIAPEVLKRNYDMKVDIFSLGVNIFQLCTFINPFISSKDKKGGLERKRSGIIIDKNIYPQKLIALIEKMINEDPNKRPTAQEAYEEVE